jgi:hypothetical protein
LGFEPEVVSRFRFARGITSVSSTSDVASGLDVPAMGVRTKNPRSFSSSESN